MESFKSNHVIVENEQRFDWLLHMERRRREKILLFVLNKIIDVKKRIHFDSMYMACGL